MVGARGEGLGHLGRGGAQLGRLAHRGLPPPRARLGIRVPPPLDEAGRVQLPQPDADQLLLVVLARLDLLQQPQAPDDRAGLERVGRLARGGADEPSRPREGHRAGGPACEEFEGEGPRRPTRSAGRRRQRRCAPASRAHQRRAPRIDSGRAQGTKARAAGTGGGEHGSGSGWGAHLRRAGGVGARVGLELEPLHVCGDGGAAHLRETTGRLTRSRDPRRCGRSRAARGDRTCGWPSMTCCPEMEPERVSMADHGSTCAKLESQIGAPRVPFRSGSGRGRAAGAASGSAGRAA